MSSTSEHLPRPESSQGHQHLWQMTNTRTVSRGVLLTLYACTCGEALRRGSNAP